MADLLDGLEPRQAPDVRGRVPADEVPLFGGTRASQRRRKRKLLAITSSVLAVVLLAGGGFVLTQRNAQTTVTLDDAVSRFRTTTEARGATAPPVFEDDDAPDTEAADVETEASQGPKQVATAERTAAKGPSSYVLPPEGVYTYKATGGEKVSIFGASHQYPEQTFATVRHLGGCKWEHRNEVIEEHVDTRHLCGRPGRISQLMQERRVTFFGTTDGAALDCGDMLIHETSEKPGATTTGVCKDDQGSKGVMKRTFVGIEKLRIGDVSIDAVRVDVDAQTTGKAVGTSHDAVWMHPETGMTLKWDRSVDTIAKAFGAKVRYQEDATFVLQSLQPLR